MHARMKQKKRNYCIVLDNNLYGTINIVALAIIDSSLSIGLNIQTNALRYNIKCL
jgi:hypothetical protein